MRRAVINYPTQVFRMIAGAFWRTPDARSAKLAAPAILGMDNTSAPTHGIHLQQCANLYFAPTAEAISFFGCVIDMLKFMLTKY